MPNASISACMVSNSAFSRAYSSLRTFDAIWGAIARGTARKRVTGRPAARIQGRCLRSAHCPHCVFSPFFSRGDIDRRAFQRAPPPSATGVREAPPKQGQCESFCYSSTRRGGKTWSFIGTTTTGSSLVHCKLYWEPACAALRLGSDSTELHQPSAAGLPARLPQRRLVRSRRSARHAASSLHAARRESPRVFTSRALFVLSSPTPLNSPPTFVQRPSCSNKRRCLRELLAVGG